MAVGLRELAASRGDRWSIDDGFGRITWAEENERTNRLIHGLRGLGLGFGDCIAIYGGNRREWIEAAGAAARSSMVWVPVNWHFSTDEVAYVLQNSGAKVLLADAAFAETARAALDQAGVDIGIAYGGTIDGFVDYDELIAAASTAEPDDQGSGRPMFYTSGTTGRPKGVVPKVETLGRDLAVTHGIRDGFQHLTGIPTTDGIGYVGAPLYHAGPIVFGWGPHDAGSQLVLRQKWDAEDMLRLIEQHEITTAYAVPTHFTRLLKLPEETRNSYDVSCLRSVWHTAAPCPPEIKRRMIEWWGPVINEL